ncbi:MAG: DUF4358 domain-containing protein [Eubacterium sp.]
MKKYMKLICAILTMTLLIGISSGNPVQAKINCKALCSAAMKATGGSANLKYASKSALDFGALSSTARKKVKTIQYVCDAKEVYSLCVMEAKNASQAKSLLTTLNKYKKRNCKSDYLSDYTAAEKQVFQNAVCGQKGNFVWYIAMSPKIDKNTKGQTALKKKL